MNNILKPKFLLGLAGLAMLASCGSPAPSSSSGAPSSEGSSSSASSSRESSQSSESSRSSESSASSASSASSSSSKPEIPDEVSISFWSTGSQGMTSQLQLLAGNFEQAVLQNTGKTVHVEVTVEGGYDDIEDKISKGLSVGAVPTMAVAYPDTVANIIASEPKDKEYLYDITPFMNDPEIGFTKQSYLGDTDDADEYDIIPAFFDEGRHYAREGMFSYPFMKSSEVMFYKVADVERAYKKYKPSVIGADAIRDDLAHMTWEEFERLLTVVMQNKNEILSTLKHAAWYDSDSNWFITQMFQREIPYTSIVDGSGSIDFESGKARADAEAMVASFKALHDDDRITTKGVENTYGSTAFTGDEVLFEIGSSGGTGYNMPEGLAPEDIGVVPVPAYNDNPLYVTQGPTITFIKNPTQTDAQNYAQMYYAWQFAKYLTNPDNNVRLCIIGSEGYIPIRYSAYTSDTYMDFLEEPSIYASSAKVLINEIDGDYYNAPVFPGSAQLRDQVGGIVSGVLKNGADITESFTEAIRVAKTFM